VKKTFSTKNVPLAARFHSWLIWGRLFLHDKFLWKGEVMKKSVVVVAVAAAAVVVVVHHPLQERE